MNQWCKPWSKLKFQITELALGVYYRFFFDRRFPLSQALGAGISTWERRRGSADIPVPKEVWDREYQAGKWEFIARSPEFPRYDSIIAALRRHRPGASVLDVGCGSGLLLERSKPGDFARYVGVDISEAALAGRQNSIERMATLVCADAETYVPAQCFDVIIFNESLYYFHDPLGVISRYAGFLNPGGIVIVSSYTGERRPLAILRRIKARYRLIEETRVGGPGKSWFCSVFT